MEVEDLKALKEDISEYQEVLLHAVVFTRSYVDIIIKCEWITEYNRLLQKYSIHSRISVLHSAWWDL